jgi:hypothetical protein
VRPGGGTTTIQIPDPAEIRAGDQLLFVKIVAVAAAVVRRDGGSRPPGTRPITPGWAWPSSGWMSCAGYRA